MLKHVCDLPCINVLAWEDLPVSVKEYAIHLRGCGADHEVSKISFQPAVAAIEVATLFCSLLFISIIWRVEQVHELYEAQMAGRLKLHRALHQQIPRA